MKVYFNESGYIGLIQDVLRNGVNVPDRTGVGCKAVFDRKLVFDVDAQFPFSTIRPAPLRMAFEEFWMFLRGETNTKQLEAKGINFWRGNTSREFLDKRGLNYIHDGDMGKAYGFQFRHFGGFKNWFNDDAQTATWGGGVDQLAALFNDLRNDPYSRRHLVTFWNPMQSHEMALTPCWHSHQYVVLPDGNGNDVLHLKMLNRSLDSVFGCMFAVQQYALYQKAVAEVFGFKVGTLSCDLTHVHIYENQIEYAEELITRKLGKGGVVEFAKELECLEDVLGLRWEDIIVRNLEVNKEPFTTERPPMAV